MQDQIIELANVLSRNGLRESLSENIDAFRAIELLGIENAPQFRDALRTTLVKRAVDLRPFEELFDFFFLGIGQSLNQADQRLMEQLGQWLAQFAGNKFILVVVITVVTIFLSEVMSNVAQVIVFAPVVSSLADAIGMNPLLLGLPMTLAASCASMLPMGTPPNAIVFASGHIRLHQMTKAGFVMNIVSVVLITLFCWFLLPLLMKM
jgi:hypothetical protein